MISFAYYDTPHGVLKIGHEDGCILYAKLVNTPDTVHCPSAVSDLAAAQLSEYFRGERRSFDFPMEAKGTPFQIAVWNALKAIPYGEKRSYGDIATAVGNPKACRAVGMACNRNPLWIVIPCHRVLGKNNAPTGYAGGLDLKQRLLELEKSNV